MFSYRLKITQWLKCKLKCLYVASLKTDNVHIAETASEKKTVFEFRHQVFFNEMNRKKKSDTENILTDEYDQLPNTVIFYYYDKGAIRGTVRFVLHQNSPPKTEVSKYDLEKFSHLDIYYAEINYIVVERGFKHNLSIILMKAMLEYIIKNKVKIDFFYFSCKPGLFEFYKRTGAICYANKFINYDDGVSIPICVLPKNKEQLIKCSSPLYAMLQNVSSGNVSYQEILNCINEKEVCYRYDEKTLKETIDLFIKQTDKSNLYSQNQATTALLKLCNGVICLEKDKNLSLINLEDSDIYLIVSGKINIQLDKTSYLIGAGNIIGEMSFFTFNKLRTASLIAEEKSSLLIIRRGELKKAIKKRQTCAIYILLLICESLTKKLKQ